MTDLGAEIDLGDHAETLVSNPAYQQAIVRVKARIYEQWQSTGFFQSKERKDLWRMARVVEDFETELRLMIESAKLAREDLKTNLQSVK